jgi:hypothetical protein
MNRQDNDVAFFIPESTARHKHHYERIWSVPIDMLAGRSVLLRFRITGTNPLQIIDNTNDYILSFMLFADCEVARPPVADAFAKAKIQFGKGERFICHSIDIPEGASTLDVFSYTDKSIQFGWEINDVHLIHEDNLFRLNGNNFATERLSFAKQWSQEGEQIRVTWLGNDFFADMPKGFDLANVPPDLLEIANDLLFGKIEEIVFKRPRLLGTSKIPPSGDFGRSATFQTSKILLCFSAGEDSTAALRLLPPDITQPYYSERPNNHYFRHDGFRIALNPIINEEKALARIPNVVRVPNNFETIGITVGMRHGYRDNFGYAALGALLANHYGANVIAFGSVLEQVFMKSGNNFTDIVHYGPSRFNKYRDLFAQAGLVYSLPTGVMSEVITNRICKMSLERYTPVPCPTTSSDGQPCGRCFKCFRKLRLENQIGIPNTSDAIRNILKKRPLKSATSLVYSVQKSGYDGPEINEYLNADLNFLERYFSTYLRLLIPPDISSFIERELTKMGISEMSQSDIYKLRTTAKIFDPDNFSEKRSFPNGGYF